MGGAPSTQNTVLSAAAVAAVRSGDVHALRACLDDGDDANGHEDNVHFRNTLLNIAMLEKREDHEKEDPNFDHATAELIANVPLDAQLEVIRFLLERGADPNRGNRYGQTPLHIIASDSSEQRWKRGGAPIHTHRAEKIVDLLVAAGAQVDARDTSGLTPLMYRVMELEWGHESRSSNDADGQPKTGSVESIRVLLKHGAWGHTRAGVNTETALGCATDLVTSYDELEHGCGYRIGEDQWSWHYSHIIDLLEAVDMAGSWENYMRVVREPRVKLWTMRHLCLAGRAHAPPKLLRLFGSTAPEPVAGAAAARTRSKRLASSAAQTTPPDEVFEQILGFWHHSSSVLPARSAPIDIDDPRFAVDDY